MPWWFLWFGFFLNYQYTASASKRRSDRRKRSSARLAIHLHRKGIRPLSVPRFRHLFTLLSKHHSKDPVFISQLKFEMANQQQKAGWLCGTCKKMRSPSSWFCEGGIYASQGPAQTAQPLAPPPPPPISGPNAVRAPWMSMPAAPGTSASSATAAEKRLNEVLGLLNKQDQDALSSDLQAFVQKESAKQTKVNAKQLHSAVDVLTEPEKAMDAALNARTNLIASWRTFLARLYR